MAWPGIGAGLYDNLIEACLKLYDGSSKIPCIINQRSNANATPPVA